jgi:hypothetical protein
VEARRVEGHVDGVALHYSRAWPSRPCTTRPGLCGAVPKSGTLGDENQPRRIFELDAGHRPSGTSGRRVRTVICSEREQCAWTDRGRAAHGAERVV